MKATHQDVLFEAKTDLTPVPNQSEGLNESVTFGQISVIPSEIGMLAKEKGPILTIFKVDPSTDKFNPISELYVNQLFVYCKPHEVPAKLFKLVNYKF